MSFNSKFGIHFRNKDSSIIKRSLMFAILPIVVGCGSKVDCSQTEASKIIFSKVLQSKIFPAIKNLDDQGGNGKFDYESLVKNLKAKLVNIRTISKDETINKSICTADLVVEYPKEMPVSANQYAPNLGMSYSMFPSLYSDSVISDVSISQNIQYDLQPTDDKKDLVIHFSMPDSMAKYLTVIGFLSQRNDLIKKHKEELKQKTLSEATNTLKMMGDKIDDDSNAKPNGPEEVQKRNQKKSWQDENGFLHYPDGSKSNGPND